MGRYLQPALTSTNTGTPGTGVMLVCVLIALIVVAVLAAPTAQAKPVSPSACDWHQTFASEIVALDGSTDAWRIAEVPQWGQVSYSEQVARIDPATPCTLLPDLIAHEWLHLMQARIYADVHARYDGDDAERVADCGAKLLGSRATPYIDSEWSYPAYVGPCHSIDMAEAIGLIVRGAATAVVTTSTAG